MGDRGVGQHAFDILLAQRDQVAYGHGEDGYHPEQRRPEGVERREHFIDDAQEQGEGGGFGRGRKQGDDRSGRALVDVGRPDVEGNGGDLEENAHEHERQGRDDQRVILG